MISMLGLDNTLILAIGLTFMAIIITATIVAIAVRQQRRFLQVRQSFTARLIAAQDEERAAVARELHDDIVQRLTAIAAQLRRGDSISTEAVISQLDRMGNDLRGLARGMHPSAVDHLTLDQALTSLAHTMERTEGLSIEYHGTHTDDDLAPASRLAIYRVAQEALGNAARHSNTDRVEMRLARGSRSTVFDVIDAGRGFDPITTATGPGIGLHSMRERIEMLGGTIRIESAPGQGTSVHVVLPHRPGVTQ